LVLRPRSSPTTRRTTLVGEVVADIPDIAAFTARFADRRSTR
jgi:hypothetical protein